MGIWRKKQNRSRMKILKQDIFEDEFNKNLDKILGTRTKKK